MFPQPPTPAPDKLTTQRMILRRWKESDLAPFAALNANAEVMEYFPNTLDFEQTRLMIERIEKSFEERALGLWAVEETETGNFIGFVGLSVPKFEAPFLPCVEIGWRLAKEYWGRGYALEAALAATHDGFTRLQLSEIVSFTARSNKRSILVMERLHMQRDEAEDFMHPAIAADHPLCRHVLYRLRP